jgi:polar amino acid transport system substrate-binding protein
VVDSRGAATRGIPGRCARSWRCRRWLLPVLAACLPTLSLAAGSCDTLVATGSPDAPPYLWRDPADPRHLIGINADLLHQVAAELGLKVELLYSGKRTAAWEEVRSGRVDLLVDAPLKVEDLEHFDYIHPAIVQNDYLVWTRQDSALAYRSLADLTGHRGVVSAKARLTPAFQALAREHLQLESAADIAQTFQRLAAGQAEYAVAGRYAGQAMAARVGGAWVSRELPVDRPGLYLALSHDSACNDPWLRGQLARKLNELSVNGIAVQIVERNVERWKGEVGR